VAVVPKGEYYDAHPREAYLIIEVSGVAIAVDDVLR
jgi:hypothetical protein